MKIAGHFADSDKLKDDLRNQNVLYTDKDNIFYCPNNGVSLNKETLDKMEKMGMFIYETIDLDSNIIKKPKKTKEKKSGAKIRISLMILFIVLLAAANVYIAFFYK